MATTLYYHPYSRAANALWMLEEIGQPYELHWIDILKGASKSPEVLSLNPMGKIPEHTDGDAVVTECAAIGLYLADRYAYGRLAPKVDDPLRAPYLRWSLFAPSVIEPAVMAKSQGWTYKETQAGWGTYGAMLQAIESAIQDRTYVLGDTFSMADVIFGGTVRFMMRFKSIEATPAVTAYCERLGNRPAVQRADAKAAQLCAEHGLKH